MRREENRLVTVATFSSGNRKYPKERKVDKVIGSARLPRTLAAIFQCHLCYESWNFRKSLERSLFSAIKVV